MSKKFESEKDRKNQREAAAKIVNHMEAKGIKTSLAETGEFDFHDFEFKRDNGTLLFIAEIKCRYVYFGKYPDLLLSLEKYDNCSRIAKEKSVPFFVIAKFDDCVGAYKAIPEDRSVFEIKLGGRPWRDGAAQVP